MKISLKKLLRLLALGAILFAPSAFADDDDEDDVTEGKDMRPIVSIDVANIKNKTDNPHANFQALIDRLNHELVQTGIYQVLNMEDLEKTLVDSEKFAVAADDGGTKTAVSSPAFYIRMTITTYGFSNEKTLDFYNVSERGDYVATVELILNLVNARTATTVASGNISATSLASNTSYQGQRKIGNYSEQALQAACKSACQKIVRELVKHTPFYVLDVEGNQVVTDIPPSVGKVGAYFDVYKPGRKIRNRRTGKVTQKETRITTIRLTSIGEDSSTGEIIYQPTSPVTDKCIVRPVPRQAQAAPQPGNPAAPF